MNREIKFRAWNEYLKKMFKIGQITLEKGLWNYEPENREFIGMSIPYQPSLILMQYTGLHDKNGKEIYEGDIVSFRLKKDRTELADLIGFIEYQTQYCAFKIVSYPLDGAFRIDDEVIIEVIGNVFEEGSLLNDSEKPKKN